MGASALPLYLMTVFIWGSTWIAITFQLGVVEPLASVIYRFALASVLLVAWCLVKKIPLKMSRREHIVMFLQGSGLFGFNYWLVYVAAQYVTSGLVAVIFAAMVFFNAVNARLFLKMAIKSHVVFGSLFGLVGVGLLFSGEMENFSLSNEATKGLLLALAATYVASLGNIAATHNAGGGRSVMAINAWGMFYGSLVLVLVAVGLGVTFSFEPNARYIGSLLYLSIFGSIITFAAYLKLLSSIGPDKTGYIGMLVPVVALVISTLFEGYRWSMPAVLGVCLILYGNWRVMRK